MVRVIVIHWWKTIGNSHTVVINFGSFTSTNRPWPLIPLLASWHTQSSIKLALGGGGQLPHMTPLVYVPPTHEMEIRIGTDNFWSYTVMTQTVSQLWCHAHNVSNTFTSHVLPTWFRVIFSISLRSARSKKSGSVSRQPGEASKFRKPWRVTCNHKIPHLHV